MLVRRRYRGRRSSRFIGRRRSNYRRRGTLKIQSEEYVKDKDVTGRRISKAALASKVLNADLLSLNYTWRNVVDQVGFSKDRGNLVLGYTHYGTDRYWPMYCYDVSMINNRTQDGTVLNGVPMYRLKTTGNECIVTGKQIGRAHV